MRREFVGERSGEVVIAASRHLLCCFVECNLILSEDYKQVYNKSLYSNESIYDNFGVGYVYAGTTKFYCKQNNISLLQAIVDCRYKFINSEIWITQA